MTIFSDIGRFLLMIKGMFSKPENGRMYWKEFMHQCSEIGIGALGIVAIISVFYRRCIHRADCLPVIVTHYSKIHDCPGSKGYGDP